MWRERIPEINPIDRFVSDENVPETTRMDLIVEHARQKILIVDDAPLNIKILGEVLISDYELFAATNGSDALKIARSEDPDRPDLILLDIVMPGMDGYEVCRRLKAERETANIPVIFITAQAEEENETRGLELGAVDYITKPFSPLIVRARVKNHLELKRHRDHLEELNTLLRQEISERRRSEEALKELLRKQEINIDLAKKTLKLLDGVAPRYTDLPGNLVLFTEAVSVACNAEGGDHYFVRNIGGDEGGRSRTVISLKDQAGHEVNCVLKSIATDIIHNTLLDGGISSTLEEVVSRLNDKICNEDILNKEDFITSINAEIDHATLKLRYLSAGHPPFLLIRGNTIIALPEFEEAGENMPIAVKGGMPFSVGEYRLIPGDKLIFYTDGLTEMPLRKRGSVIDLDELKEIVSGIMTAVPAQEASMPVSDIMDRLLKTIAAMSDEEVVPAGGKRGPINTSDDDVTVLCLEIENRNNYTETVCNPQNCEDISKLIYSMLERIEDEWNQRGYAFPDVQVGLVLEEAVINAWKHGNKRCREKTITVRWGFCNHFRIEVIDEGKGFDYEYVPDPTLDENLKRPFGRGIYIIRHSSDLTEWRSNGKHLVAYFKKCSMIGC